MSSAPSQSQALDPERLQELLRPIRELSAVWDIHLANYLDEYLENISTIDLSEDYNPDTLNFSQAGLLIQGTTNIYAKKVKHLYDLVTSSTVIPDTDETQQKGKKRQRKTIEYVSNEKLVPIDLPDTIDSTTLDTDEPRLDVTTMPKIPFCLLHSLDSKTASGQNNYRINNVPNQENGVIILDGSQKFSDFSIQDKDGDSESEQEADAPIPSAGPASDQEQTEDAGLPLPEPMDGGDDGDFVPGPPDDDTEQPEKVSAEVTKKGRLARHETPKIKKQKPRKDATLLDPDAGMRNIMRRPYQRMAAIKIPTSFGGEEKPRGKFQKPFHEEIFAEIDERVNEYRKKREREEGMEALNSVPIEEGREHIVAEYDAYVDPDLGIPSDNDDADNEPPIPSVPDDDMHQEYSEICKNKIKEMIEEGKRQTKLSETMKAFNEWEAKLSPILDEEKKRKGFDITETRKWIICVASEKGGTITFSNLTSGLLPHEISRVFLSSLFLSNTGDIGIENNVPCDGDFTITLLRERDAIISSLEDEKDGEI